MFSFKRKFSLLDSPVKGDKSETPAKLLKSSSPFRLITSNGAPPTTIIPFKLSRPTSPSAENCRPSSESPQPVTVERFESFCTPIKIVPKNQCDTSKSIKHSVADLKNEKLAKLAGLDEQINAKLKSIKEETIKIRETQAKRFLVDDFISMANKSQIEVRNHLNQMYNPGNEIAKLASNQIEVKRKAHDKKLEKLTYELTQLLGASKIAIERKEKQLSHEIELHKRTLMTLESREEEKIEQPCQAIDNKSVTMEENQIVNEEESSDLVEVQDKSKNNTTIDDECVILEDSSNAVETGQVSGNCQNIDLSTDKQTKQDSGNTNASELSVAGSFEEEEEQDTDIDEDNGHGQSFTPFQAQRPK